MNKVKIIAEAGVNHNGSIEIAKKLILSAKEAGADIVKFQTFNPNSLVSKHARMAEYQKENMGLEESQKDMLSDLTLSYSDFEKLAEYAQKVGIEFLSTPFDLDSIHFLDSLVSFWKIPSGEVTDYPYLREIAMTGKNVVLSTGMCTIDEIRDATNLLYRYGTKQISILHCNTQYPTPYEDVNLNVMDTLRKEFNVPIGYSDHTKGIEVPIAAVAMGATIIEKHFTLDRNLKGPDHRASLEPDELRKMVCSIRNIEKALGSSDKMPTASESLNICVARRSIVAMKNIKKGEVFSEDNLTTKRPGTGINPMMWNDIIGRVANRDFEEDEIIEL